MKTHIQIAVLLFLFIGNAVLAQEKKQNQLIVYGDAELKIQTDIANFNFSVKGVGPSLEAAVNVAKDKVKKITNELRGIGLIDKNFSTSSFYSGENRGEKAFLSDNKDYKAEISVGVSLDSLNLLEPSIMVVGSNDPNYISDVSFSLKDNSGYNMKVWEAAGLNAKEKAENLAKEMKFTLGKVLFIEENGKSDGSGVITFRGGSFMEVASYYEGSLGNKRSAAFYSPVMVIKSHVKVIYELP